MKYKVVDIFSGCGGMSWGLHKAGFEIIAALDYCPIALKTFALNHPSALIFEGDIRKINPLLVLESLNLSRGDLDCLVGGPPCQGFSKNVPATYRFLEDSRNQLFNDYLDYVEALFPKVVIMENVAEIYNAFNGVIRNQVIERLEKLGYQVEVKILFGPDFGVPQRRSRCFFFASRTNTPPVFPTPTHGKAASNSLFSSTHKYISAWDAISDLPSLQNGEGLLIMPYDKAESNDFQRFMRKDSNGVLLDHKARELTPIQFKRISSIKAGQGIKDLPKDIQPKGGYSGAYGRLDFENVAPTITRWVFHLGSGRYGHPKDDRLITIREAARLQCFTDDFKFHGTYIEKANQIGNAVPSIFMYKMAKNIKDCLIALPKEIQQNHLSQIVAGQY
jgi:DNA (cytosine-5)-methyltransferase 1